VTIPLLAVPERRWECPNCDLTDVTREAQPHSRFHNCAGLAGLSAPMVPAGTRCKVTAHEREDYIGAEDVQYDGDGRPIMAIVTTRDEGQDCTVLAPCATARSNA
jgi:hypothetical protein